MALIPKSLAVATVATAGTQVTLTTAAVYVKQLTVHAPADNVGIIYLGDGTVDVNIGIGIAAGGTYSMKFDELVDVGNFFIDGSATDEVRILAFMDPGSEGA